MNVFLTYYKKEVYIALIWFFLCSWALTATVGFLRKKDQIIFVKIKSDSVDIVRDLSEQDEFLLEKIFIKRFSQFHYTYDSNNFEDNLKSSSNYMKDDLWKSIGDKIRKQKDFMGGKIIAQTAVIEKIVKKDWKYEINLNLVAQKNTDTFMRKFKIILELQKVERTINNPFGLVVTSLNEEELAL
ncbi:MAG: hypothetical protein WA160_06940 [Pseudobdellovibrio sp.]